MWQVYRVTMVSYLTICAHEFTLQTVQFFFCSHFFFTMFSAFFFFSTAFVFDEKTHTHTHIYTHKDYQTNANWSFLDRLACIYVCVKNESFCVRIKFIAQFRNFSRNSEGLIPLFLGWVYFLQSVVNAVLTDFMCFFNILCVFCWLQA